MKPTVCAAGDATDSGADPEDSGACDFPPAGHEGEQEHEDDRSTATRSEDKTPGVGPPTSADRGDQSPSRDDEGEDEDDDSVDHHGDRGGTAASTALGPRNGGHPLDSFARLADMVDEVADIERVVDGGFTAEIRVVTLRDPEQQATVDAATGNRGLVVKILREVSKAQGSRIHPWIGRSCGLNRLATAGVAQL